MEVSGGVGDGDDDSTTSAGGGERGRTNWYDEFQTRSSWETLM
jgi:hypothetical protein